MRKKNVFGENKPPGFLVSVQFIFLYSFPVYMSDPVCMPLLLWLHPLNSM